VYTYQFASVLVPADRQAASRPSPPLDHSILFSRECPVQSISR
jgi:hypothetical protein